MTDRWAYRGVWADNEGVLRYTTGDQGPCHDPDELWDWLCRRLDALNSNPRARAWRTGDGRAVPVGILMVRVSAEDERRCA